MTGTLNPTPSIVHQPPEGGVDRQQAALDYVGRGWRIVRLYGIHRNSKGYFVCDCGKRDIGHGPGKHPIGYRWHESSTTNPLEIERWWEETPNANVGWLMGKGLVGIDLDLLKSGETGRNGIEQWEEIQRHCGEAPRTLTSRTGSGGLHLFFREPLGVQSGNAKLPALKGATKIDQRGENGQLVLPPSLHYTGNLYQWEVETEIALAPEWLYETTGPFARTPKQKPRTNKSPTRKAPSVRLTVERDPEFVARVQALSSDPDPNATLTKPTQWLLENGLPRGDRSALTFRICLGATARNYDGLKLYFDLLDPTNHGGERLREELENHGEQRAQDWYVETWLNAQRLRVSHLQTIEVLRQEAAEYQWTNVTFLTNRCDTRTVRARTLAKVLDAVFTLAERYTTTAPMVSQQELVKITNLTTKTVRNALAGLEALGWLVLEEQGAVFGASTYLLITDPQVREDRRQSEGPYDIFLARHAVALDEYRARHEVAIEPTVPLRDFDS